MEGDGLDSEERLAGYVRRSDVLRELRTGGTGRNEIEDVADVSESTAHRILNDLIESGIAERRDRGVYELTSVGEAVLNEVERFQEGVGSVVEMSTVVEAADEAGVGFDASLFADADVTVSDSGTPYEPARRFVGVLEDSDELRLLAASSAVPVFSSKARSLLEGDEVNAEVICPHGVVEPAEVDDHLSVRVHSGPPLSVALFDDRIGVAGHGDDGNLDVFAVSEDDEAYDWGEKVYETYRSESERYF